MLICIGVTGDRGSVPGDTISTSVFVTACPLSGNTGGPGPSGGPNGGAADASAGEGPNGVHALKSPGVETDSGVWGTAGSGFGTGVAGVAGAPGSRRGSPGIWGVVVSAADVATGAGKKRNIIYHISTEQITV